MPLIRAVAYFVEEALESLWRSRLMNALSVITITVSLFVLGAFLTVAAAMNDVVERWARKVQVVFYLEDGIEDRIRQSLEDRLRSDPAVLSTLQVTRTEALERFRAMFRDLSSLPDDLGENPFPASVEVTLRPTHQSAAEVQRFVLAHEKAPGVIEVQYDLLWIERLATAARVVRGVGAFLGGILVAAGIFTISNVIRLTVYAREDELDIMRLVGATRAYVKGPFVTEGMIQGALGGGLATGLLLLGTRVFARDVAAASELFGRVPLDVPGWVSVGLVVGGTLVGVVGSLVSLGRLEV
jgi:cell division transport system permease protein